MLCVIPEGIGGLKKAGWPRDFGKYGRLLVGQISDQTPGRA
jgi:hypothetical protein